MDSNSSIFVEKYYMIWHPNPRIREDSRLQAVRELSSVMDYRQVYMAINHTKTACLVKLKRIWEEYLEESSQDENKIRQAVKELEWMNEQLGIDEPVTVVRQHRKPATLLAYC